MPEERTVGSNRLIDGAKLDAINLNGGNKVNANSIGSGNVSDAEFEFLNGLTSNIQEQINNIESTGGNLNNPTNKEVADIITESGTFSYDGTCVINTKADGTVISYCPAYISEVDSTGGLKNKTTGKVGVWDSGDLQMNYSDGMIVKLDGTITYSDAKIAYTNKMNEFTQFNKFIGNTLVGNSSFIPGGASGVTGDIEVNGVASLYKFSITGSSTHNINFSNILNNQIFGFVIVQTGTGDVNMGTVTDSGSISSIGSVFGETYPLSLTAGSHLFVAIAFETAIHIKYVGQTT